MNIDTIEKAFSSALGCAKSSYGKKFQARICEMSGVHPPNLSAMLNKDGGCSEEMRRKIIRAVSHLLPDFPAKTYDEFLSLGAWITAGNDPNEWLPPADHLLDKAPSEMNEDELDLAAKMLEPFVREWARKKGALDNEFAKILFDGGSNITAGPPILQKIPIISWVRAGCWSEVDDQFQPGYAEEWIDSMTTNHPNAFALVVHGDSMEPEFVEGDIITVDPEREAVNGSYVIAKNGGEEATFKRLIIDGPNVYLRPINESKYKQWDMTGVEFRIIGVVVEKVKRY